MQSIELTPVEQELTQRFLPDVHPPTIAGIIELTRSGIPPPPDVLRFINGSENAQRVIDGLLKQANHELIGPLLDILDEEAAA